MAVAYAMGEDRSNFQHVGTWAGNAFGFAKATEGTSFRDPTFKANWANLKSEGKVRGAYHFFHPALSAVAQARYFVSCVDADGGIEPGDMLMADVEILSGEDGQEYFGTSRGAERMHGELMTGTPATAVGSSALEFLTEVQALAGPHVRVLLYSDLSMISNDLGACSRFALFAAYYSGSPPRSVSPWQDWVFWQKSGGGGLGGGDLDYFNGDEASLAAWTGSPPPVQDLVTVSARLPVLKLNDQDRPGENQAVGKMQALLSFVGTKNRLPAAAGLAQDGHFGPGTLAAVEAAQAFYKILNGQGQCGERTWAHLLAG
jgi:GH25 family lysozyme M1 (1,4-beta-N-acetylmuramidase)